MKELELFTVEEKKVMRPLLKAKEQGDGEAAIKFDTMWVEACKRAIAEYKKHPENEKITYEDDDVTSLFLDVLPMDVKAKIAELEEEIAEREAWLKIAEREEWL